MPLYYYKAVNDRGNKIRGSEEADNVAKLVEQLKSRKIYLLDYSTAKKRDSYKRSLDPKSLSVFFTQLGALLRTGVSLPAAVDAMRQRRVGRINDYLDGIYRGLLNGTPLSDSVMALGGRFPPLVGSMLAMGEKSGTLDAVCKNLGEHYFMVYQSSHKLRGMVAYPIFCLFMVFALGILIDCLFMPDVNGKPFRFYNSSSFVAPIVIVVLFYIVKFLTRFPFFKRFLDNLKLSIPFVKTLYRSYYSASFSSAFAVLYDAGINAMECMQIAGTVVTNSVVARQISSASETVRMGTPLAAAMKNVAAVDDSVIQALIIGEKAGTVAEELDLCVKLSKESLTHRLDMINRLTKPVMLVFIGLYLTAYAFSSIPTMLGR